MIKLHRVGLVAALAALVALGPAQRSYRSLCPWQRSSARMLQNPPEEQRPPYVGAAALTIGALGLVARSRRR